VFEYCGHLGQMQAAFVPVYIGEQTAVERLTEVRLSLAGTAALESAALWRAATQSTSSLKLSES
jgi:hypothetical protein